MSKVKVHKFTIIVVDHDNVGADEMAEILQNARYPNHCVYPQVIRATTKEIEWTDDHPLNGNDTAFEAALDLFNE